MKRITIVLTLFWAISAALYGQVGTDRGDEQGMEVGKLDLRQDSVAIQKALNGWWKDSQQTLDERMEWYNDAKFGCFIHWGVYSEAGGEWNGRPVNGYSEHLMRKERIPLDEYKERLVYPFDPSEFDADEWMRHASEAGMRYFIVTAKHHDGFAMYHSDAYPYDMRLTRFDRDPMKELREAATKYGIKFGFYYSHAFDWEHPDAPGNDWMYDNPGGDSLLGGANWWLTRTDFLPHADKYVTEKSIPQIRELIDKYDPDILWFDTPHKLPLYQNIRILEAIRQAAPDVVVNGRLARFPGGNLGDYVNTGDRAAYFFPQEGYWESIPTTNESYGYSKHDHSHKSVSHFVRLVSSATAKGGNILMNVGPMGNGKWDETDVAIFKGVGEWLEIYGEAIYGNRQTDLPVQSWGVTTRKDDVLYLHVHHWPENGTLTIGGLASGIEKAWIVSDPAKQPLSYRRIDACDVELKLPTQVPDTMNTVIALLLSDHKPSCPVRLLDPGTENILQAFDAQLTGRGFGYGDGKTNRNYVRGWRSDDQFLAWPIRLDTPAAYRVVLEYNTETAQDSGKIMIEIDGNAFAIGYTPHPENRGVNRIEAGNVRLASGEHMITLKGGGYTGSAYLRPTALYLLPLP